MTYHIYIGYDDREHEAFLVAKYSLEKHATCDIKVHKLHHKELRQQGLLMRGATIDGYTGQYIDAVDSRPFSTQFTFSRFLIAELWRRNTDKKKNDLVMFVDCDFLFLEDIKEMFTQIEAMKKVNRGSAPVYCVKHDYNPSGAPKMDNIDQTNYNMKLWAALMVLDMSHPDNVKLVPQLVNTAVGRDLMNFCWVSDVESIGELHDRWQFLPNHTTGEPSILHWTEGGPYFSWCRDTCGYTTHWFTYYKEYLEEQLEKGTKGLEEIVDG